MVSFVVDCLHFFISFFIPLLAFMTSLVWYTLGFLQVFAPTPSITVDDDFSITSISYFIDIRGVQVNTKWVFNTATFLTVNLISNLINVQLILFIFNCYKPLNLDYQGLSLVKFLLSVISKQECSWLYVHLYSRTGSLADCTVNTATLISVSFLSLYCVFSCLVSFYDLIMFFKQDLAVCLLFIYVSAERIEHFTEMYVTVTSFFIDMFLLISGFLSPYLNYVFFIPLHFVSFTIIAFVAFIKCMIGVFYMYEQTINVTLAILAALYCVESDSNLLRNLSVMFLFAFWCWVCHNLPPGRIILIHTLVFIIRNWFKFLSWFFWFLGHALYLFYTIDSHVRMDNFWPFVVVHVSDFSLFAFLASYIRSDWMDCDPNTSNAFLFFVKLVQALLIASFLRSVIIATPFVKSLWSLIWCLIIDSYVGTFVSFDVAFNFFFEHFYAFIIYFF